MRLSARQKNRLLLLSSVFGFGSLIAQAPNVVQWGGVANVQAATYPGDAVSITINGVVLNGWHVYALNQLPEGPTPLKATIAENNIAQESGKAVGTPAVKRHDESFHLETQTYSQNFALTIPARIKPSAPSGHASIPVAVHFQACSDRVCLPPRTVQVPVALEISARP